MSGQLSEAVLQRRVFNQAIYDLHVRDFMLGQTLPYISKHKNVVDVGAAVGMYSNFWAPHCNHLYAFEAVPEVYEQLKKVEQKFDNMDAYNCAVGMTTQRQKFYVDANRLSNSSFTKLVDGYEIEVETVMLDAVPLGDVGFLKIDVEGHEMDVLQGGLNLIDTCRPTVMCEIFPMYAQYDLDVIFNFFFKRDYACFYNYRGAGLIEVQNVDTAVLTAENVELIKVHDGDFLFVHPS